MVNAASSYAAPGATAAHDPTDRIVYNKTTGALYFDKEGIGGAPPVEFAVLTTHPASLNFDDFVMIA